MKNHELQGLEIQSMTQASVQGHQYQSDRQVKWSSSLKALFLKSLTLQKRSYCSNICQIATPLLCLLFTLAVKQIVGTITTSAVYSPTFMRPFNLPMLNTIIRPNMNLVCGQMYYYQTSSQAKQTATKIIKSQLKETCPDGQLSPVFVEKDSINKATVQQLIKADKQQFQRGNDLKTQLPDGVIKFKQANPYTLVATVGINDFRLPQYHKNNGVTKILIKTSVTTTINTYQFVTQGTMSLIDKITRPFLQQFDRKQIIAGSYMYMPFSGEDKSFVNKMINVLGSGLYPLGMSLLLPVLLFAVVSEKQQKQLQIMKMNGLDPNVFWINFMLVSLCLSFVTSLNMYIWGSYIIQVPFFTDTSFGVIWLLFGGWAIAQTAMASFFQVFLDSARTATIIGYVLSIFSTLLAMALCTVIFPYPMQLPLYFTLYPPFSLSRVVYHIGLACSSNRQCPSSISSLQPEAIKCLIILYSWFFVYIFSIWLSGVVQQEYGVARRPAYVQACLNLLRRKRKEEQKMLVQQDSGDKYDVNIIEGDMQEVLLTRASQLIDESVKTHTQMILRTNPKNEPLLIRGISKRYETDNGEGRIALKPISIRINKGEIFGFLGPNGAGKTTLISVLTGMYPSTQGQAWIAGLPVGDPETNKRIGVCPQFDILWRQLSVIQHLLFYSRLKGVPSDQLDQGVKQALQQVDLWQDRNLKAGQLSGGMQRRLSIAAALVGKPSVLFLDQPSSGLDPYHRRQIWQILARCKHRTSIFMTSHLMDEVQFLCQRIGVISQGQLRCIGSKRELKDKFGDGYRLTVSYGGALRSQQQGRHPAVTQLIEKMGLIVKQELQTRTVLKMSKESVLGCTKLLRKYADLDWSIASPSLYDVFTHFVK